jgi:heat shock protein HtpX
MVVDDLVYEEGKNVIGLNRVKTWILIAALGGLFVLVGSWLGGTQGAAIALVIALVFNFSMYWFSDKIAIATTRSHPVTEQEFPAYHRIVRELTQEAGVPMPRLYVSEMLQPNAFATGRNPDHAAVSVTKGILQILDERELRAVLAHELSHVANRDILISSIAAAIGMSITFLTRFVLFFGSDDNDSPLGGIGLLLAWILAPLAAAIIQMAVSRSREFQADESGALLSADPDALASSLRKLDAAAKQVPVPASVSPAEAHLFIVNPFGGRNAARGIVRLFSTHPPMEERIARLEQIKRELGARAAG